MPLTSAAHTLLRRLDVYLSAPVPQWYHHNADQFQTFGSVVTAEDYFRSEFGSEIRPNYLTDYEACLQHLSQWAQHAADALDPQFVTFCSVVQFQVHYCTGHTPSLRLSYIRTRPCACGLGILKQILYVLHCHAKQQHITLSCHVPLSQTRTELIKISEEFCQPVASSAWCLFPDKLDTAKFELKDRIKAEHLCPAGIHVTVNKNPGVWPSADDMNSQEVLDTRFAGQRPEPKSYQEAANLKQVTRFEVHIHRDSAIKPLFGAIMYFKNILLLYLHLDGKRYSGFNQDPDGRVLIQESAVMRCEWCIEGSADGCAIQLRAFLAGESFSPIKMEKHICSFTFEPPRMNLYEKVPRMDVFFPDAAHWDSMERREYTIIDVDLRGREFEYAQTNFEQVRTLLCTLSERNVCRISTSTEHDGREEITAVIPGQGTYRIDQNLRVSVLKPPAVERDSDDEEDLGLRRGRRHRSGEPEWEVYGTLTTTRRLKAWLARELLKGCPEASRLEVFTQHAPDDAHLRDGDGAPLLPPLLDQR
jgi:hypothetical protein